MIRESLFYIHEGSGIDISSKIVDKLCSSGNRVLFLVENEIEADVIDNKLWTFSKLSFIPHVIEKNYNDNLPIKVVISDHITEINNSDVLLHCDMNLCDNKYREKICGFSKIFNVMSFKFRNNSVDMSNMFTDLGFQNKYFINISGKWDVRNELP